MNNIPTSWMWRDEATDSIKGVTVDFDAQTLQWYDEPGCACTGADAEQTIVDFLQRGTNAVLVPDEIFNEMQQALEQMKISIEDSI